MRKIYFLLGMLLIWNIVLSGCKAQLPENRGVLPATNTSRLVDYEADTSSLTILPKLSSQSTLSDYLAYAALNNSGLEAAFNRWKAALQNEPQVTSLPDPQFTYKYFIEQVETRVGAQRQSFALAQKFPWFGKLKLRGSAAADAARAAKQQYEATKLKLFFQVKNAYYEYYYLGRAIGIIKDNIQLVQNFERVARTRYKAALGKQPDVIRIQVELGKLEDRLKTLQDLKQPIVAQLNAALNRPANTEIGWPGKMEQEKVSITDQEILKWMANSNPELKALKYEIARTRTNINLAKKDYYPDITLGVNYIDTADATGSMAPSDSGKDPVIAILSINLPLWRGKLDAGLRQAMYNHRIAIQNKMQKLNSLNAEIKMALYKLRDAQRKIILYRDTLLPKAIESVKVSEASFGAGSSSFTSLIDAQRIMLEFQLSYERALANYEQVLARIEMLAGRQIPRAAAQPKS